MLVKSRQTDDPQVTVPKHPLGKLYADFCSIGEVLISRLQNSFNPILHSPGFFNSLNVEDLNQSEADIVNLHWTCDGFLSVKSVSKIRKPIVWTLHDSWVFCGSEHHPNGLSDRRFVQGYRSENRLVPFSGYDIDKWTWDRKRKNWKQPIQLVTPSAWLASAVNQSALAKYWPVTVIPNAVATDIFKPVDQNEARKLFDIPQGKKILLFGALSYQSDRNKGYDLLKDALNTFLSQVEKPEDYLGVVFGQATPEQPENLGLPLQYVGYLEDDQSLSMLYNAADVVIVPSRMENLPQIATEAQSCGTPVVAFNTCGIPEAVIHEQSGYLATPYDTKDLAKGIQWVMVDAIRHQKLGEYARERALKLWAPDAVANQYSELFKQVLRA